MAIGSDLVPPAPFRRALLEWFEDAARPLPWRSPRTLYGTLVSEFMLQQTRVTTVLPYFERWMTRFPALADLAKAPEADVLKHWEGLGYYQRARNLHRLARTLLERYPGENYPTDAATWITLPGIGPYTAAAVTSQVFGEAVAAIDGNVIRVLARLTATDKVFRDNAAALRHFQPLADALVDPAAAGLYNEALMELGATICQPRKPGCLVCPLFECCRAGQSSEPTRFPQKRRPDRKRATIHRILIVRQRPRPAVLLTLPATGGNRLADILEVPTASDLGHPVPTTEPFAVHRRAIGNTDYEERFFTAPPPRRKPVRARWVELRELDSVTLSGPHRRWLPELINRVQAGSRSRA